MSTIDLSLVKKSSNEPRMHSLADGFLSLPSVAMRLAPEILTLELFREVFFGGTPADRSSAQELQPDLRSEENEPIFDSGERAVITALRGRRKLTKGAKENRFYAPAYPSLARASWLRKKGERVIVRLLFQGAFAQSFWSHGADSAEGKETQRRVVEDMIKAFMGSQRDNHSDDILKAALGESIRAVSIDVARQNLLKITAPSSSPNTVFEADRDELADRIVEDFLLICELEQHVPRLLWLRILMSYLRFALPVWLLAQMRITVLVHGWMLDALNGANLPNQAEILRAFSARNLDLLSPTLTPTREVYSRITEYIRCRVELNVALFCLEQLRPDAVRGRVLSTRKVGQGSLRLIDALGLARATSETLRAESVFGGAANAGIFLARVSESFRAWRDPLNKGQGKNIDEFLRVLYRAESGDEAGGYLLIREGRAESAGFRVFPGQLLLQNNDIPRCQGKTEPTEKCAWRRKVGFA